MKYQIIYFTVMDSEEDSIIFYPPFSLAILNEQEKKTGKIQRYSPEDAPLKIKVSDLIGLP